MDQSSNDERKARIQAALDRLDAEMPPKDPLRSLREQYATIESKISELSDEITQEQDDVKKTSLMENRQALRAQLGEVFEQIEQAEERQSKM